MITLSILLTVVFTAALIFLLLIGAPASILVFVGGDLLIAMFLVVAFTKLLNRKK